MARWVDSACNSTILSRPRCHPWVSVGVFTRPAKESAWSMARPGTHAGTKTRTRKKQQQQQQQEKYKADSFPRLEAQRERRTRRGGAALGKRDLISPRYFNVLAFPVRVRACFGHFRASWNESLLVGRRFGRRHPVPVGLIITHWPSADVLDDDDDDDDDDVGDDVDGRPTRPSPSGAARCG